MASLRLLIGREVGVASEASEGLYAGAKLTRFHGDEIDAPQRLSNCSVPDFGPATEVCQFPLFRLLHYNRPKAKLILVPRHGRPRAAAAWGG